MKWTRDEGILVLDAKYLVCAQLRFWSLSELNPNQTQLYRLSEESWVSVSPAQSAGRVSTQTEVKSRRKTYREIPISGGYILCNRHGRLHLT